MYEHLEKLEKDIGIPITRIKGDFTYEYLMFEYPVQRPETSPIIQRYGAECKGYGWPGPRKRWCTDRLKGVPKRRFLRELGKNYDVKEYIGIAADEEYRLERKNNQDPNHIHPLVEWGMTEADCLAYCYERGYDWGGLYNHFKRVSCWCCPLQSLDELRKLHRYYPDLWEQMKEWDKRTWRSFRADYSVEQLEVRFLLEQEYIAEGKSIKDRVFFRELKKRLGNEKNVQ